MAVDTFGITKIQPDMSGGMKWEADWATTRSWGFEVDPNDDWFDTAHGNGSYRTASGSLFITGENPRMYIRNPDNATQWRDVEITCYFKRVSDYGEAAPNNAHYYGMEAVARTQHLDDAVKCDSRGVDARMRVDGHIDFEKETSHPNSTATANKAYWTGGMPKNVWIGYKYLCYDLPNGDVKLELYIDESDGVSGGNWVLLNELVDDGLSWGSSTACAVGIDPKAKLTNAPTRVGSETGLPNLCCYFRTDYTDTDGLVYKKASVREIDVSGATPPVSSLISFAGLNPSTTTAFGGLNDTVVTIPPTQPSPPTLAVGSIDGGLTANWQITSDGNSPITGWLVRAYPTGEPAPMPVTLSDANLRTYTFTELSNDTTYTVEVAAVNAQGASTFASSSGTPAALPMPPGPPTALSLTPLNTGAGFNLSAPVDMGTGVLESYQVTVTDTVDGGAFLYSVTSLPSTLLGLPNDHLLSVEAKTVTSDGISSGATAFVTPTEHPPSTTPPDAPTEAVVTVYTSALGLSWTVPAVTGTYSITDYVIRASTGTGGEFDHWYVANAPGIVIGGLADGVEWTIDIWARSMVGKSLLPLETVGTPDAAQPVSPDPLTTYGKEPPPTTADNNPIFWLGYVPPAGVEVGNPDVPPPAPMHLDPPNIFAFYPAGTTKADGTTVSDGAFNPFNWAGL